MSVKTKSNNEKKARYEELMKQVNRDTQCHRWNTCKYGTPNGSGLCGCNYCFMTGKLRGGYPDECQYYERKKKKERASGWITPAILPK